ncbi:TPA: hypothetical protein G8O65_000104 [Salmonella enterica]|uniref:Uncharacterized protein n=1 Tax=Salmonella enterica TaxID=28901 RepID=A0A761KR46_SALER|nr:hypothetical protein [Salmonella enterica]HDJ1971027.1 hypothetical protein [Salmonella enterica subsp. enterica]HAG5565098.1 hypothetical protein [Salmonella enterica]HAK0557678.1 hypothetical protein [Salmonella enterica]HAK0607931.1 hypothetical protein [Salmonella enterica]
MNKIEFITLMSFPMEWLDLDMYPDLLFLKQLNGYEVGHEDSSDHDRNGAFHWWLKKKPSKDELMKLVRLALIDPDQFLSEDIIRYIKKSSHFDRDVDALIEKLRDEKTQQTRGASRGMHRDQ